MARWSPLNPLKGGTMSRHKLNATKAQARGAAFEQELEQLHDLLRRQGKADVRRMKAPVNLIGSLGRGQFRAVLNGEPHVDFEGVMAGGQAVCFDAKHVERGASFAFSQVRDNQVDYLRDRARFGALSFVLVRCEGEVGRRGRDYIIPVDAEGRLAGQAHARSLKLLGQEVEAKSIKWQTLERMDFLVRATSWADQLVSLVDARLWPGRVA